MTDSPRSEAKPREMLAFQVGAQEYCVDVMAVRELRGWTPATSLPRAPDYVRGVINLRGIVLPVVDMSSRLGLARSEPGERHVVIVVSLGPQLVGLLVDAVCEILEVADTDLQLTPDVAADSLRGFISALVAVDGRMIGVLALDRLLPELDEVA
jgi:purine-binding chemotaxis protein CheW